MTNDLIKPDIRKGLAKSDKLYLLNLSNGRVFDWTAYLAVRKGFVDCTVDGVPVDPKSIPGDHPFIQKQVKNLRNRVSGAGGNADTLYQIGQQLTADGKAKFKALDNQRANDLKLENSPSAASTGAKIRVYNKIDVMCERAKKEIRMMVMDARVKLGLITWTWRD